MTAKVKAFRYNAIYKCRYCRTEFSQLIPISYFSNPHYAILGGNGSAPHVTSHICDSNNVGLADLQRATRIIEKED